MLDVITPYLQSFFNSLGVYGQLAAMVLPVVLLWYREKYRPSRPAPDPSQPVKFPLLDKLLKLLGGKPLTPELAQQLTDELQSYAADRHAQAVAEMEMFGAFLPPVNEAPKTSA